MCLRGKHLPSMFMFRNLAQLSREKKTNTKSVTWLMSKGD